MSRPEPSAPNVPRAPAATFLGLCAFSVAGLAASRAGLEPPGWLPPASSLALLAAGCWTVAASLGAGGVRGVALCAVVGLAVELLGAATGFPFGSYEYTGAWWPTLAVASVRLSLPVGLAWAMVAGASYCLAPPSMPRSGRVAATALLAACVDLAIEPVMAGSAGYWRWLEPGPMPGGAPLSNFAGWVGAAALCGAGLVALCPRGGRARDGLAVLGGFGAVLVAMAWAAGP